jgi:arylsulfatase A
MGLLLWLAVLFLSVAILTPASAQPARAKDARQPKLNFVFILIDDMGWKDVGCNGSTFYQTPNIDHLAAQGMRFTNGYAACPVCSPTRASIMTGKYPARLHLTDWLPGRTDRPSQKLLRPQFRQYLPLEEVTIARSLKPLGYASASIGKWHLGGKPYYKTNWSSVPPGVIASVLLGLRHGLHSLGNLRAAEDARMMIHD